MIMSKMEKNDKQKEQMRCELCNCMQTNTEEVLVGSERTEDGSVTQTEDGSVTQTEDGSVTQSPTSDSTG
jgi:2C-methyl-D-erythritol 2,4-cyclodiphosphate synthase